MYTKGEGGVGLLLPDLLMTLRLKATGGGGAGAAMPRRPQPRNLSGGGEGSQWEGGGADAWPSEAVM